MENLLKTSSQLGDILVIAITKMNRFIQTIMSLYCQFFVKCKTDIIHISSWTHWDMKTKLCEWSLSHIFFGCVYKWKWVLQKSMPLTVQSISFSEFSFFRGQVSHFKIVIFFGNQWRKNLVEKFNKKNNIKSLFEIIKRGCLK